MKKFLSILFFLVVFFQAKVWAEPVNYDEVKRDVVALYNTNKLQEAYQLAATIPEADRDAEVWLILANITQDYDKDLDAVFLLSKAIEKNPKYYKAYYNLGNLYFEDNKLTKAVQNYELAVKYNKDFAYGYYNLGCCYLKDALFSRAKSYFLKAIKLKPNEPIFYYNLALTYKKMNKNKQAARALDVYNKLVQE